MIKLSEPWREWFKDAIKEGGHGLPLTAVSLNMARKNQLGIAFFSRNPGEKIDIKQQEIVCRYMHRLSKVLMSYHTIWISWQEFKRRLRDDF